MFSLKGKVTFLQLAVTIPERLEPLLLLHFVISSMPGGLEPPIRKGTGCIRFGFIRFILNQRVSQFRHSTM